MRIALATLMFLGLNSCVPVNESTPKADGPNSSVSVQVLQQAPGNTDYYSALFATEKNVAWVKICDISVKTGPECVEGKPGYQKLLDFQGAEKPDRKVFYAANAVRFAHKEGVNVFRYDSSQQLIGGAAVPIYVTDQKWAKAVLAIKGNAQEGTAGSCYKARCHAAAAQGQAGLRDFSANRLVFEQKKNAIRTRIEKAAGTPNVMPPNSQWAAAEHKPWLTDYLITINAVNTAPPGGPGGTGGAPRPPTFAGPLTYAQAQTLVSTTCVGAGCHGQGAPRPQWPTEQSMRDAKIKLINRLAEGAAVPMPPPPGPPKNPGNRAFQSPADKAMLLDFVNRL